MCGNSLPSVVASTVVLCCAYRPSVLDVFTPSLVPFVRATPVGKTGVKDAVSRSTRGNNRCSKVASVVRAEAMNANGATGQAFNLSL